MSLAPLTPADPVRLRVLRDWRRPDAAGPEGGWRLHWREAEGWGQILPRPTPEEAAHHHAVPDYYTHGAREAAPPLAGPARALRHAAWRLDRGAEADAAWWSAALGPAPLRVLEMGCGDGATLRLLAGLGHRVEGVEPDPEAAARAQAAGIPVRSGTAEAPPEGLRGPFDAILLLHVLEHCLDPAAALVNLRALAAPGARLVVEVPNNACWGARIFAASWHWLDVPRHVNFFTPRSLEALLRDTGWHPQETAFWGYARQFGPDWRDAQARIGAALGCGRGGARWRYALLLALSGLAPPARKYDSVRILARPAGGSA
ncbi:class I SAM-dependent methyltransferase [Rubellimicrobium sp. CFH 75288]|uniref:class I SAM-dependent methyltransferase n=1 Tax=Rubellimicrobium sp. CFH 75288 TaxID=2697034 RepID=UPI0014132F6B|nr:class I SAM-dependent methyltransferase [Rubellimicrobium sp. CFH 75288]NAZ36649.1 methyltransferase domain-containing protein [Rubellimicrobium sp. CFH 75288]